MRRLTTNLFSLVAIGFFSLGCSSTPKYTEQAFEQYGFECVARGLAEDTPAHSACVTGKYKNHLRERQRAAGDLKNLYSKTESSSSVTADTP